MRRLVAWLKRHSAAIGSATGIVGVLVGIGGFYFTIQQLRHAETTLRAANTYQIQSDARELVQELVADPQFTKALQSGGPAATDPGFLDKLWLMANFYLSVYRQDRVGGLSSEFGASFADDFCSFFRGAGAASGWDAMKRTRKIGARHQEMRDVWCKPQS